MSKPLEPDNGRLDEQVAALTDHLMNQGSHGTPEPVQDDEMRSFVELLTRLSEMAPDTSPDQEMVKRVRAHLETEWNAAGANFVPGKLEPKMAKAHLPSGYQSTRQRRIFTLRLAFATMALVVLLAFFISPTVNHAIPGAAGGQADLVLVLGMIILCIGLALWWVFHRKG